MALGFTEEHYILLCSGDLLWLSSTTGHLDAPLVCRGIFFVKDYESTQPQSAGRTKHGSDHNQHCAVVVLCLPEHTSLSTNQNLALEAESSVTKFNQST